MKTDKRILFLCRRDDREHYDTAASMAKAMRQLDSPVTYAAADLEDLVFVYDGATLHVLDAVSGKDIAGFDGVFLLGWFKTKILEDVALATANYVQARGGRVLNSEVTLTRSRTKLSQYVIAAIHDIPIAPFVFSIDTRHLQAHATDHGIEYPLIMKSVTASRGADNHLVKSVDELQRILAEAPEVPFVLQSFVPNDGDYRLLVMGEEVRVALYRQSQSDSHINNTSQGGLATLVDPATLNSAMLAHAVEIARLLRREVTGVDMIVHRETGEYAMLEANNMPQLSTGKLVDAKMQALDAFLQKWVGDAPASPSS